MRSVLLVGVSMFLDFGLISEDSLFRAPTLIAFDSIINFA